MSTQFKKSITDSITNSLAFHKHELELAQLALKENPKAVWAKTNVAVKLREYQIFSSLNSSIKLGNFDDVEFYNKYIDTNSDFQIKFKKEYGTNA